MSTLEGPIVAAASGKTTSLVIFLHGYGADGNDLIGLSQPLAGILPDTAFASPNAPEPCAAAPTGRQWFPIPYLDGSSEIAMMEGLGRAKAALNAFMDAQMTDMALTADRVALVGFSQGTMMSLEVGLRREAQLAGIVGFSGRLLRAEALDAEIKSKPPVLLVHGDADQVVPPQSLDDATTALKAQGIAVDAHSRPGLGHGIDNEGLSLAAGFLSHVLK
jgi:phospholipase/carboxylesterase